MQHGGDTATRSVTFKLLWAPVSATVEGQGSDPLTAHLRSDQHRAQAEAVVTGKVRLVSRAAMELSRALDECPTNSLSRFRMGLRLPGHLCSPTDVECARRLERVREASLPLKIVRELLTEAHQLVWITPEQMMDMEEESQRRRQRQKGGGQRS